MSGSNGRRTRDVPTPAEFTEQFDEPLARVLDPDSWREGIDPTADAERIGREVRQAVEAETGYQRDLRDQVLPLLADAPDVEDGGVHEVTPDEVVEVQRGLLYNG